MNAFQPSPPPQQPIAPRRRVSQSARRQQQRHPYRAMGCEMLLKLVANGVISAAAIAALAQLLPYHLSQQSKLREVRAEARQTEKRVTDLRTNFSRYFDPQQAKSVMQEQSYRRDPTQRQVVWQDQDIRDSR
ncbi:MAG: hypothetical protein KME06_22190 [Kastovskya adunca ATA6-11-RM4]|nr:hypothetical protein [Kastovskya adunca ATA6-11-RM4]